MSSPGHPKDTVAKDCDGYLNQREMEFRDEQGPADGGNVPK